MQLASYIKSVFLKVEKSCELVFSSYIGLGQHFFRFKFVFGMSMQIVSIVEHVSSMFREYRFFNNNLCRVNEGFSDGTK